MHLLLAFALLLPSGPQLKSAGAAFRAGHAAWARGDLARAHAEFAKVVRLAPQVAAGHSAYGAVLLGEGDTAAAIPELELAHHLDAKDDTATLNLATAYGRARRYPEAIADFRELRPETLTLPEAALGYATALAGTGDLAGATTSLRQGIAANPQNAALHDALGTVLAQQQRYSEAQPEMEQAVALDQGSAPAHLHLGSLYLAQQNAPAAVKELTAAAALTPNDLPTLMQLGRAQTAAHDDEAAAATFARAQKLAPQSAEAAYALALALQNTNRSREALPFFQTATVAMPRDSAALVNYGLALVQNGNAKDAIPLYERALALESPHGVDHVSPVLRENLGVAYLQQSDLDHAITQFQAGLALPNEGAPLTAELHYDLGLALKLKDKLPEATVEFERAAKADPALPDPPYTLGVLYMQTGRFAEAAAQTERAVELRPENGEAWANLGNLYKQMDQPAKAVPALHRAIELLPAQPSPHITLAAILAQQGDREGAAAERKLGADLSRIAVSRQRADFALNSGTALLKQGKLADAMVQLQAAVAADPSYAAPHRVLADALSRQGNTADAALERQRADAIERR